MLAIFEEDENTCKAYKAIAFAQSLLYQNFQKEITLRRLLSPFIEGMRKNCH